MVAAGKKAAEKPKASNGKDAPKSAEHHRLMGMLEEIIDKKAPKDARPYLKQAASLLVTLWLQFLVALPHIVQALTVAQEYLARVPEKLVYAAIGFAVCFFGGIFPATIAAAEAFQLCGGRAILANLRDLYAEFSKAADSNDGDSSETAPKDLIARKAHLVLKSVNPERVSANIVGLYTAWVGMLAILKIQFARTVTLGEAIGTEISKPAAKLEPVLATMVPEDYKQWVPVMIRWSCKMMAISAAWWIQRAVSCIHSSIRGGQLFGKYLVDHLHETGVLSEDAEKAYLDDAIAWGIAALGVLFQFSMGFGVPFPLNIVMLPVSLLERFIVWSVAF